MVALTIWLCLPMHTTAATHCNEWIETHSLIIQILHKVCHNCRHCCDITAGALGQLLPNSRGLTSPSRWHHSLRRCLWSSAERALKTIRSGAIAVSLCHHRIPSHDIGWSLWLTKLNVQGGCSIVPRCFKWCLLFPAHHWRKTEKNDGNSVTGIRSKK